jgi:hypothetical protein
MQEPGMIQRAYLSYKDATGNDPDYIVVSQSDYDEINTGTINSAFRAVPSDSWEIKPIILLASPNVQNNKPICLRK